MKVTLDHIQAESSTVSTFLLRPPRKIAYTAGQYIELLLPHVNADERGEKHWFTLSSSPSEELLSITTKFAGAKGSSFKRELFSLRPGHQIDISEPMGDFVLPKDTTIPLVFVAGGIGVTPFRSITKWLIDTKEQRDVQILLAANRVEDIIFKDLFESYGVKPVIVLNDPPKDWEGESGRLSGPKISALIGGTSNKRQYISGPEQMVETLETELKALGVSEDQLVGDFFPGYPAI